MPNMTTFLASHPALQLAFADNHDFILHDQYEDKDIARLVHTTSSKWCIRIQDKNNDERIIRFFADTLDEALQIAYTTYIADHLGRDEHL